ncbi:MAG TPA: CsgG/HfaB family protein, partial [Candidatus Acidoferrales bacterium]|nr:CsgG/HfaB family protein [Candidatus Acidoferrales bacterium]
MKRLLIAAVGTLCLVGALAEARQDAPAAAPGAPTAPQGRKKRVAIFDFDYATVRNYSIAAFGSDIDVGKGITDLLTRFLVENGTYSVIERKALDKILAEQNFSNSDRANPNSAAKLGKILGVDAIIVGSVTQFGNETKGTNVGGAGGGLGRFGLGGVSHKESKA